MLFPTVAVTRQTYCAMGGQKQGPGLKFIHFHSFCVTGKRSDDITYSYVDYVCVCVFQGLGLLL